MLALRRFTVFSIDRRLFALAMQFGRLSVLGFVSLLCSLCSSDEWVPVVRYWLFVRLAVTETVYAVYC